MKHSIRFNIFVLIILGFISCRKTRNVDVVGIIEDAITGEPVVDADVRLFTDCSGFAILGFCKGGEATVKSNVKGQFSASVLTNCSPGIEVFSEYICPDAYVFIDEDREMKLKELACNRVNTARIGYGEQIDLKIKRYPGVRVRYDNNKDSTMVTEVMKVESADLLVDEVIINGVHPVKDTSTTIVFNIIYDDKSTDRISFDYHYLNNNLLRIKRYK